MIEVNVKYRILKPVNEVFMAIVDPAKMSNYFISGASGPMKTGTTVEWDLADVGRKLIVEIREVEENQKIVFDWMASGTKACVTINMETLDANTTLVSINELGWPMDHDGIQRALGQTQGWTDFLCCMKAFLQHGINLRLGRSKDDH